MNKINYFWIIAVASMMILVPVTAWSEMIQGVVDSVDKPNHFLRISRSNPSTGTPEEMTLTVPKNVTFDGIKSLEDLQSGIQVQVETAQGASGLLEAKNIKASSKPGLPAAQNGEAGQ